MNPDQTVSEMVEGVLSRQARDLARRSGTSFENAMAAVAATEAGARLRALGEGEHRYEKARSWQANLVQERARRRVGELGWQWRPERTGPPPSDPALPRESPVGRVSGKTEPA